MNRIIITSISFIFSFVLSVHATATTCDGIVGDYSNAIAELARGYINLEKLEAEGTASKAVYISTERELQRIKSELIKTLGEKEFQRVFGESVASQRERSTSDQHIHQTRRQRSVVDERALQPYRVKYEVPATHVTLTKDKSRFLSVTSEVQISMRDFATSEELYKFPFSEDIAWAIKLSPDNNFAAGLHVNQKLSLWNAQTGASIYTKDIINKAHMVEFSPDSQMVAIKKDRTKVSLLKISDASILHDLDNIGEVISFSFSYDNRFILTTGEQYEQLTKVEHRIVRVWDINSGKELQNFPSNERIISAEWQPGGELVLIGSSTNSFTIWDPVKNEKNNFLDYGISYWSEDGRLLMASRYGKKLSIWQASDLGNPLIEIGIGKYSVLKVELSPDRLVIAAVCDDGHIRIWKLNNGYLVDEIKGNFKSLEWSANGEELIVISLDQPRKAFVYERGIQVNSE